MVASPMAALPTRPAVWIVGLAALVGVSACASGGATLGAAGSGAHRGFPAAAVTGLQRQADQLLSGGPTAFKARFAQLRGAPIVVNQWASWCGPCRYEFPFFQRLAHEYAGRVAFIGVDSQDSRGDAARFLRQRPVPYPHYYDQDSSIARLFGGGRAWPTTAFFDGSGRRTYLHPGSYATQAKLDADIRRYALHG